ncbi:hypothetical protein FOCC_FOCC006220 [Frankliniella occidentalis]|nr:hypothetical protein FOCC_FOCC006220 [Frankliniella occidentalis]
MVRIMWMANVFPSERYLLPISLGNCSPPEGILKDEVRRRLRKPLTPTMVSTDYEQGAIKAAQASFPGKSKGRLT